VSAPRTLGLVGARGHVGRELSALVARHGALELGLEVSQRDKLSPEDVARGALDAYVLALPNGASEPYVQAITKVRPDAVIVDLSADHRFDAAWVYGQPERKRAAVRASRRIANPGCYATAMQLAVAPLVGASSLAVGPISVFGVSGYSGAGTTPSPKNDPENLRDNLLPYSLVGHVHEREVAAELGLEGRLFFMPHVASFFRGISVTVSLAFHAATTREAIMAAYRSVYAVEPMVVLQDEAPVVRDITGRHHVAIGGVTVSADGRHGVVVATIDNLLGGAASQALRNLNLALGFDETRGLEGAPDAARE